MRKILLSIAFLLCGLTAQAQSGVTTVGPVTINGGATLGGNVASSGSPTLGSITVGFKGGSTASATLTIGAVTLGQIIVTEVGTDPSATSGGSIAITDNCNTAGGTNTYSTLTNSGLIGGANGAFSVYAWTIVGATTSSCTITYTESVTTGNFTMAAAIVLGGTTVEESQLNYQGSPGTAANAITSTATGATSHLDLVLGFTMNVQNGGAAIPSAGTGFAISSTNSNGPISTESLTQSSTGTATATFTTTTSGTGAATFTAVIALH